MLTLLLLSSSEQSPCAYTCFTIDLDGSGTIEFDEYVRVMATYCMFTKDEILRFCFECFDVDKSGTIDEKEFVELCK
jgi:Ca2+-binding EF-hand superfamily protein